VTPNNVLIAQGSDMVCVILYAYIFSLFGSIVAFLSDSPNRSLKKWALGVALSFPIFLVGGFLLLFTMAMAFRLQV
jgi:hypothetical protein